MLLRGSAFGSKKRNDEVVGLWLSDWEFLHVSAYGVQVGL